MEIKTPAKINPYLRILGRMGDGTHQVDLALVCISLYDELELLRTSNGGIELTVESAQPLGTVEDNLVFRAAREFARLAGGPLHVRIHLQKNIPAGAGLGGGSGNAAGTLLALNAMHGQPLDRAQLEDAALKLGADVPFFLSPVPRRAVGRGEILSPLQNFPRLLLLLVKPPFSISTGEAYRGVTGYSQEAQPPVMTNFREVVEALHNQFEAHLLARHPELGWAKARLLDRGAAGALLSGSGSAIFGVFEHEEARVAAVERLSLGPGWQVFSCETLSTHSYLPGDHFPPA